MSERIDGRSEVLARIRAALGPAPAQVSVLREYRTSGEHPPGSPAVLALLTDRLVDYRATVRRSPLAQVGETVRAALTERLPQGGRVVAPAGLPTEWLGGWPDVDTGDAIAVSELDEVAAVVTGCAVAAADTGTIVLDGSPDQGRRAITLVPDVHLVVVRAEQVVQTVPEALARLDPLRPLTMISGPSATSDIELQRVEGVHGPRTLLVVLAQ